MILQKKVEDKTIVWLQHNNQYLILENIVAEILQLLSDNVSKKEIITGLLNKINIPYQEADNFVTDISKLLKEETNALEESVTYDLPKNFKTTKYYQINGIIFNIDFLSDYETSLIHPKFAHLEVEKQENFDYHYQIFIQNENIFFLINNSLIGSWPIPESHYFQGKFSMKIVEHIHQKEENKWMGVFHASAVSNHKESILFLGDSGNGKSTSLSLLQANGFTCLADDFVPVSAENQEVYAFPSAISIKKNSVPVLLPLYPELETSAEYNFKSLNKIVRYLPPNNTQFNQHQKCKALVFIKYKKDSDLSFQKMTNIKAFEKLVPDSWLSPIPKNSQVFLDWFSALTCYELVYSNNEKMITTVQKIFDNEL